MSTPWCCFQYYFKLWKNEGLKFYTYSIPQRSVLLLMQLQQKCSGQITVQNREEKPRKHVINAYFEQVLYPMIMKNLRKFFNHSITFPVKRIFQRLPLNLKYYNSSVPETTEIILVCQPMLVQCSFLYPLKIQKTFGIPKFSGGIEMENST